ncbi:hypothetical protein MJL30_39880 [Salmonella enterica subsp. enterica serovar Anatum]|nr:hypothetical protein [Salmonella enterica subsp. enterica serovar Anatum]
MAGETAPQADWRAVRRAEKTCVSCQGHRSGWTGNPAG